jgi:hypothetical protein
LMNLLHIFSAEKIMLNSSMLIVKDVLLEELNQKLTTYFSHGKVAEVVMGKYEWNSPVVAAAAIKQGIYDGTLLTSLE